MGELLNMDEVLNTVEVLSRETQRPESNEQDEYGMPLRRDPPTPDLRQYYTKVLLIAKLRSTIPLETDLFLQTTTPDFHRGDPADASPPLSLLRIGYIWSSSSDDTPIEPLFVADRGAYYSDPPDLVPYNASGECRRALVASDGFWGTRDFECFNRSNGLERENVDLASSTVRTLVQFLFMLGDRRLYLYYDQPHDAGLDVHIEQLVHVLRTATHERMYPHRAKQNPRPPGGLPCGSGVPAVLPRTPPPSPARADARTGLTVAEHQRMLQGRLQELRARQEMEQWRMQMQQPLGDPRLMADASGMSNLGVGPGTLYTTSGFGGDGGGDGSSGSGEDAAVGGGFASARTGSWGPPADDGVLPVGSGHHYVGNEYTPADDGYGPTSNGQAPTGGFDFVFQVGGGHSHAASWS